MDRSGEFIERHLLLLLIDAVKYAHLSHTEDIDRNLERSFSRSCVMSSAIMLECFANILIDTIPGESFRSDVDKLQFLSKIDTYLMSKGLPILDRGTLEVQRATELKSIRDRFVHPKKKRHQATERAADEGLSFNIPIASHAQTKIPVSPGSWSASSCVAAVGAAVGFLRHLLAERLKLSADDAFQLVCSEFVVGESRAVMTETELSETRSQSKSMGIDLGFLLPDALFAANADTEQH